MATFRANGEDLELPAEGSLTLDDAMIVYAYSGLTLNELEEQEGIHPGVLAALVHVGVARAHPELKAKEIEKEVRALNLVALIESLTEEAEQAEQLDLESRGTSDSSTLHSGSSSETSSEISPEPSLLRRIGTHESAGAESDQEQGRKAAGA